MLFSLTDEQLMIQSMVREFARKVIATTAAERDRTKEFPAANLKKMAELGLMGMMVPPEYGGEGADTISYFLALSEIAYSCAATAVVMSVHNSIVCESILRYGSEDLKQRYLPVLADGGKMIGAFALTEPEAGSDPVSQITTAVRDGDHYVINGTKRFTTTGKNCGLVIVTAKTDETLRHKGISAFIVDKGTPGFKVGHTEDKMGLKASDTTDLIFDDCRVPADQPAGGRRSGIQDRHDRPGRRKDRDCRAVHRRGPGRAGCLGQICQTAGAVRAEDLQIPGAALDDRRHGHRNRSRPPVGFIGRRHERPGERYTQRASMAKLFASEMVNRVTAKAIQIHGGYGFTKDYSVERYYRDARVFTIYEGTSEIQRVVISNHILKDKRLP
jgi:butyryl-CoA dehydrogenase